MIRLTVALPIFNSARIAWLAMESLCRQKNINFQWELIAAEESQNAMGFEKFISYRDRLKEVGCTAVDYISLDSWKPLPHKWRLIGKMADKNSIGFIMQAADCYSEPNRLTTALKAFEAGYDWVKSNKGLFYHLGLKKEILYNANQRTGLNMAFATRCARELPLDDRRAIVDGWLANCVKSMNPSYKIFTDESENWKYGVDTHGLNNISKNRERFFSNPTPPFESTDLKIKNFLPADIFQKLNSL